MTTTTVAASSLTHQLASRWAGLAVHDLPDEAAEAARHCLLDWFGCAIAGAREPLSEMLAADAADSDGTGPSHLIGRTGSTTERAAALVNGAAGHALDFDDTHTVMSGHPSVPVVPAALALAERLGASTEVLLPAVVAGIEVECRAGALLNPKHYLAGWHATGTLGTLGAAAACSVLLGLDEERTAHALALAATQAAGVKASFGTMAKPLHAGKAASDGLLAARLAARGFIGNPAVVEAEQGLALAAGGTTVDLERLERFRDSWLVRDTLFKYHAACYLTHASINAALALRDDGVDIDAIESVDVHVAETSLGVCNISEPGTGLEGKFSLRATTAMALLGDDTADLAAYSDARMNELELIALRDKVRVVPEGDRLGTRSKVVVALAGGRRAEAEDDTGRPAADLALQRQRLSAKFRALAEPVLGAARAAELEERIGSLPGGGAVAELVALAQP